MPGEPAVETAPRGKRQRESSRRQAFGVEHRDRSPDLRGLQALQFLSIKKTDQLLESMGVVAQRSPGQPPLML